MKRFSLQLVVILVHASSRWVDSWIVSSPIQNSKCASPFQLQPLFTSSLHINENKSSPPTAQNLMTHLQKEGSDSRFLPGISIVSLNSSNNNSHKDDETENGERGVQYTPDLHQNPIQPGTELAFISSSEFITPSNGRTTAVGRIVTSYLDNHPGVNHDMGAKVTLPSALVAIYLSLSLSSSSSEEGSTHVGAKHEAYLATLPSREDMNHIPVFWGDEAMEELQRSLVVEGIKERRSLWEFEYGVIQDALLWEEGRDGGGRVEFVDFGTYSWARSIVCSRAFTFEADNEGLCLVPFIDMLNHHIPKKDINIESLATSMSLSKKCDWHLDETGFFLTVPFTSTDAASLSRDEKWSDYDSWNLSKIPITIEISYGSHSNAQLMMNYGFSVFDDKHQTCLDNAIISLSPYHQLMTEKITELWENDNLGPTQTIPRGIVIHIGSKSEAESLLSLCRIASCNDDTTLEQMKTLFQKSDRRTTQDTPDGLIPEMGATLSPTPFSVSNEINAMAFLKECTEECLERYETTLREDDAILQGGKKGGANAGLMGWVTQLLTSTKRWGRRRRMDEGHGNNVQNAVILRRGEKRVLQHFYNFACINLDYLKTESLDFDAYKDYLARRIVTKRALLSV